MGELLFPRRAAARLRAAPAALAWGRGAGLESLCAYIACADGSLYAVCPFLPPGIELSRAAVDALRASAAASAAAPSGDAHQVALTAQWLDYFRPLPGSAGQLAYCPPQRDPRDLALLHRAVAALDAGGYARAFAHAPALQGPIATLPRAPPALAAAAAAAPLCDVLVLAPEASPHHTTVALLYADGKLTLAMAPDSAVPLWGEAGRAEAAGGASGGGGGGGGGAHGGAHGAAHLTLSALGSCTRLLQAALPGARGAAGSPPAAASASSFSFSARRGGAAAAGALHSPASAPPPSPAPPEQQHLGPQPWGPALGSAWRCRWGAGAAACWRRGRRTARQRLRRQRQRQR